MRRPLTAPEQRQRRHFKRGKVKESDPSSLRFLLALLPEEGIEQNFICFSAFVAQTGDWKIVREREI